MGSDPDEVSVFETTAEFQQGTLDYYQEKFDRWLGDPLKILWDDYRGRFGLIVVTFYVLMGTIGVQLFPAPHPNMAPRLVPAFQDPQWILGTDASGRGLASLMVHATPSMLKMMISGAIFGNLMGVTFGLVAGYMGGKTDKIIMTFTDTLSSIPGIPLLIILAAIIEPTNPWLVGIMINIQGWAGGARTLRAQVLPLAELEHVEASIALGESTSNLLVKEVLPHLLPLVFIGFLGGATRVITASVGLYFLGVLPFSTQNWGVVLNSAVRNAEVMYAGDAVHWLLVPTVTIVGLTLGLTLLSQALDQVFNPRVRARHRGRENDREADKKDTDIDTAQTELTGTR